jgi:hypothetical protein
LFARKKSIWFIVALVAAVTQAVSSFAFKEGYAATVVSDVVPLVFTGVLILLCWENFRASAGSVRMFWYLNAAAFVFLMFSHAYWFFYEVIRKVPAPSPLFADGCFFLMPALMLAALAFRPHSLSAASDLRFRRLDFAFLLFWWLCFYFYFAVPWLSVVHDYASYNPANYYLDLVEQLAVVIALVVLWRKTSGAWRKFYGHACLALLVYALANFVQGLAMSAGKYYSGGIYDLPIAIGGLWVVYAFATAGELESASDSPVKEPERQGLWTARLAILAMISLPLLAIYGYLEGTAPVVVIAFRLRLILIAMLFLGSLGFLRLYLVDRELRRLVSLTESSYDSLKNVQERMALSQKFAALGRLAAGAAHEINNPLTAIYGYCDLLGDHPSLSPSERRLVDEMREQVRLAQSAVASMRDSGESSLAIQPPSFSKLPSS